MDFIIDLQFSFSIFNPTSFLIYFSSFFHFFSFQSAFIIAVFVQALAVLFKFKLYSHLIMLFTISVLMSHLHLYLRESLLFIHHFLIISYQSRDFKHSSLFHFFIFILTHFVSFFPHLTGLNFSFANSFEMICFVVAGYHRNQLFFL